MISVVCIDDKGWFQEYDGWHAGDKDSNWKLKGSVESDERASSYDIGCVLWWF